MRNVRYTSEFDVYVGRSPDRSVGVWGNPFSHQPSRLVRWVVATPEEAVARYREWLMKQPDLVARAQKELHGKVLACWCAPSPCHAYVLAEVANEGEAPALPEDSFDFLECFDRWVERLDPPAPGAPERRRCVLCGTLGSIGADGLFPPHPAAHGACAGGGEPVARWDARLAAKRRASQRRLAEEREAAMEAEDAGLRRLVDALNERFALEV